MSDNTLEREDGRPEQWQTNIVMRRNENGNVETIVVPDDTEVTDNACDD